MNDSFDPVLHSVSPSLSAIHVTDTKYGDRLHISMDDPVSFMRSQRSFYIKGKYLPMERKGVAKDLNPGEYITPTGEFNTVIATIMVNAMQEVLVKHNTLGEDEKGVAITGIIDPSAMAAHTNKIMNIFNLIKPQNNGQCFIHNDLLVFMITTCFIETATHDAVGVEPYIQIDDYMDAMYRSMERFREDMLEPPFDGLHPEQALALSMLETALTCVPSIIEQVNASVLEITNEIMH